MRAIVVGTSFGGRVQVPALRAAGFEVAALVGRNPERTAARASALGVPLATTDLGEALDAVQGPRCVAVATPPDTHRAPVLEALAAGAHVLCEKPFALRAADAEAMVAAAEDSGVVAVVGCEFRFAPDEALAGRLVRTGTIGTPKVATFLLHSTLLAEGLPPAFNDEWWFDPGRGGGLLNAAGVHFVDRFRTWLGEVTEVSAHLGTTGDRPATSAEDTYTATLRFAGGCIAVLQHCAASRGAPVRLCRVVGDRGTVWVDDGDVWLADAEGTRRVEVPRDLAVPPAPPVGDDPTEVFTGLELPPYTRLAERFGDLIAGRRIGPDAPATPTFGEGLRTQRVLDAMRASSAAGGRWVSVPAGPVRP